MESNSAELKKVPSLPPPVATAGHTRTSERTRAQSHEVDARDALA